jgi:hypothetical protein
MAIKLMAVPPPPLANEVVRVEESVKRGKVQLAAVNYPTQPTAQGTPQDINLNTTPVVRRANYGEYPFTGGLVLPANPNRVALIYQNNSLVSTYISLTGLQPPFTSGIVIGPNGTWEPDVIPTNSISFSGAGIVLEA